MGSSEVELRPFVEFTAYLRGAEIDPYGNISLSLTNDYGHEVELPRIRMQSRTTPIRFPGRYKITVEEVIDPTQDSAATSEPGE